MPYYPKPPNTLSNLPVVNHCNLLYRKTPVRNSGANNGKMKYFMLNEAYSLVQLPTSTTSTSL